MNRFEHVSPTPIKYVAKVLPYLFFITLLVVFIISVSRVSSSTLTKQKESIETALKHSIAQCYAVEGSYPADLDYIEKKYGLTYDKKNFLINYTYYGGNLYPEVSVMQKTGQVMR